MTAVDQARILVFAREPRPGQVKTRLVQTLGPAGAAALHHTLVDRTLDVATAAAPGRVELCCTPDRAHPLLAELAARHGIPTWPQGSGDLGTRMARAVERAGTTARHAIIIGADCPAITADYIRHATAALADGRDAVIGPAEDGGYVLIGLRRPVPGVFLDIPWGGTDVCDAQRERFAAAGLGWTELAMLWDLDRPSDLARYRALFGTPATRP
jgi:rSAM/selenodomain-associated transferase 1